MQARSFMHDLVANRDAILVLQRAIRAATVRIEAKEEVARCDRFEVSQPQFLDILSPREGLDESVEEKVFISQSAVNRSMEADFGVSPIIIQYFTFEGERKVVRHLEKHLPKDVFGEINCNPIYGYYQCEKDDTYAIV